VKGGRAGNWGASVLNRLSSLLWLLPALALASPETPFYRRPDGRFVFHGASLAGVTAPGGVAFSTRGATFTWELEGSGLEWGSLGAPVASVEDHRAGRGASAPAFRTLVGSGAEVQVQVDRVPGGVKSAVRFGSGRALSGAWFRWRGALAAEALEGGRGLRVSAGRAAVSERGLRCFQELSTGVVEVPCRFVDVQVDGRGAAYRVEAQGTDPDAPVVVDPVVTDASEVGGSRDDTGPSIHRYLQGGTQVQLLFATTLSPAGDFEPSLNGFAGADLLLVLQPEGGAPSFQLHGTLSEDRAVTVAVRGTDWALVSRTRTPSAPVMNCPSLGQPGGDGDWDGWLFAPFTSGCLWFGGPGEDVVSDAVVSGTGLFVVGHAASDALAVGALPQPPVGGPGFVVHCPGSVGPACVPGLYAGAGSPQPWAFTGLAEVSGRLFVSGAGVAGGSGSYGQAGVLELVGAPDGGRLEARSTALLSGSFPPDVALRLVSGGSGLYVAGASAGAVTGAVRTLGTPGGGRDGLLGRVEVSASGVAFDWASLVGGAGEDGFRGAARASGDELLALGETTSGEGTLGQLGRGGDAAAGQGGQALLVQAAADGGLRYRVRLGGGTGARHDVAWAALPLGGARYRVAGAWSGEAGSRAQPDAGVQLGVFEWSVDESPPAVSFGNVEEGGTYDGLSSVAYSASADAGIRALVAVIHLEGGFTQVHTDEAVPSASIDLVMPGTYTLDVTAISGDGFESTGHVRFTVTGSADGGVDGGAGGGTGGGTGGGSGGGAGGGGGGGTGGGPGGGDGGTEGEEGSALSPLGFGCSGAGGLPASSAWAVLLCAALRRRRRGR
jgi:hypothetical protein